MKIIKRIRQFNNFKIMAQSMAKLGKSKNIDFTKPVIPTTTFSKAPLDEVEIPFLAPLKQFDCNIQWNYVGDNYPPSKFYIQVATDAGPSITCSFTIRDKLFSITELLFLYNGANLPLKNLDLLSFQDLIDFLSLDLNSMIEFVGKHYKLNDAILARLQN